MMTVSLSKFVNNRAPLAVVYIPYHYSAVGEFANNLFSNNNAAYEVFVSPVCQPGLFLSFGTFVVFNALKTGVEI